MHYTSNHPEVPHHETISKQPGRCKGNASKATKTNNHRGKDLARPLSTPPLHPSHGTINQFPWILIELEHQEEIGEAKEEVHRGET